MFLPVDDVTTGLSAVAVKINPIPNNINIVRVVMTGYFFMGMGFSPFDLT
jgi:hypothetical protein